jgi:hypothetical protein
MRSGQAPAICIPRQPSSQRTIIISKIIKKQQQAWQRNTRLSRERRIVFHLKARDIDSSRRLRLLPDPPALASQHLSTSEHLCNESHVAHALAHYTLVRYPLVSASSCLNIATMCGTVPIACSLAIYPLLQCRCRTRQEESGARLLFWGEVRRCPGFGNRFCCFRLFADAAHSYLCRAVHAQAADDDGSRG